MCLVTDMAEADTNVRRARKSFIMTVVGLGLGIVMVTVFDNTIRYHSQFVPQPFGAVYEYPNSSVISNHLPTTPVTVHQQGTYDSKISPLTKSLRRHPNVQCTLICLLIYKKCN